MKTSATKIVWALLAAMLLLTACTRHATRPGRPAEPAPAAEDGAPAMPPDIASIPDPVPRVEPLSRYGNQSPYTVLGKTYRVLPHARGYVERGMASWYGTKFHGRPTSSFEPYDLNAMTAAHKTLPLPTYARVTNLENGRSVIVRINDRGPFKDGRLIDLSYAAAIKLGVNVKGTAPVEVRAIDPSHPEPAPPPLQVASTDENRRVYVQVGSYGERSNAEQVRERLRTARLEALIEDARVRGKQLYRVRLGPIGRAAAAGLVEIVRGLGLGTPKLITE